jgi:hypothetical protein
MSSNWSLLENAAVELCDELVMNLSSYIFMSSNWSLLENAAVELGNEPVINL